MNRDEIRQVHIEEVNSIIGQIGDSMDEVAKMLSELVDYDVVYFAEAGKSLEKKGIKSPAFKWLKKALTRVGNIQQALDMMARFVK